MRPEVVGESFGDEYGTMLAARAADGDGQVAAVVRNEIGSHFST
jgi:hypothetical protein